MPDFFGMKKARFTDIKERESIFFIGKWLVFFSIIVISSLSFALGYLVGKYYHADPMHAASSFFHEYSSGELKTPLGGKEEPVEAAQGVSPGESQPEHAASIYEQTGDDLTPKKETAHSLKTDDLKGEKQKDSPSKSGQSAPRTYTVQVGAFRQPADAAAFKDKFDQKGFMVFVQESLTKNHEKIYKVRVGEFRSRKEAERMSAKIKKAEGLSTFVTFK
jgi:cell division septation protein DedD